MAAIKALQQWCKKQCQGYGNVEITNMTTSWRDGLAFCAILHHFRPDLIDFDSLKKEDVYENNKLAFQVAEEELGIPALLDAEDMVMLKVPDRLSILTYVSQYYNYFTGRSPIGGMAHIKRSASDSNEEPVQKKSTPETKPKVPKNTLTPSAAPTSRVAPKNKVPVADAGDGSNKSGTLSSNCTICKKTVLLVQRYLVDGKLYHRNCFRCKQCSTTLMAGAYKTGPEPGTFICINHQAKAGENNNNSSIIPTSQGLSPKPNEPAPTVHKPVLSHVTGPAAVMNTPKQANASLADFKHGNSHAETMQAARQRLRSSGTPEKGPISDLGSPASSFHSQNPVGGQHSWMETMIQKPWSPGNQERTNMLKSPSSTTRPSSDLDKDKARLVLQKNLPFDNNNNRSQGVTSPSRFNTDKPSVPQPTRHQTAKALTFDIGNERNIQSGTRQSVTPEQRSEPSNTQASKWRPISSLELSSRPVVTKGVANAEVVLTPSTDKAPRVALNRASSMNEATGRGLTLTQQINSKGNFSYSPQIITRQEVDESPSDWRSKLKPVQKHHSFGPSDVKHIHSSSINLDIKKPDAFGNTANTPSTPKTAGGSNWTPSTTQWNTSTSSGKHIEVTFSLHNPGSATISTSSASPARGVFSGDAKTFHPTQEKRVLKPGVELLAGAKNGLQSPSPMDKNSPRVSPFEKNKGSPQAPGSSPYPALDRVTEELPGRQSWVQGKLSTVTAKTARAKFFEDDYVSADPKESQDHGDSPTPREKTTSSQRISEEDIQKELRDIGKELDILEQKGVDLEPQLRSCEGDEREDDLMVEWFKLIHEKQLLMRRESELVYISQQQILEDRQCQIDQELRTLMEKSEEEKTDGDRAREQELMEELLKTVEDRNNIIDRLDEDRVREKEEDQMMEAMINRKDINKETEQDLKKKNKFSPLKFLKGLGAKPKGKE
ncbi:MICAL-like protein 2 [Carcharodon carcharias]|uniref:MICAL-like protein 2 n=1 Tax=Carcharodon carcharias TaxID=13397 RepID=UPI001B7D9BC8|nr:MICAL-like protein 2 [Carcharodon carcharias]